MLFRSLVVTLLAIGTSTVALGWPPILNAAGERLVSCFVSDLDWSYSFTVYGWDSGYLCSRLAMSGDRPLRVGTVEGAPLCAYEWTGRRNGALLVEFRSRNLPDAEGWCMALAVIVDQAMLASSRYDMSVIPDSARGEDSIYRLDRFTGEVMHCVNSSRPVDPPARVVDCHRRGW